MTMYEEIQAQRLIISELTRDLAQLREMTSVGEPMSKVEERLADLEERLVNLAQDVVSMSHRLRNQAVTIDRISAQVDELSPCDTSVKLAT